jgi:CDP-6-deoxy-D-xylo-4-hexulose-3-dehydrase
MLAHTLGNPFNLDVVTACARKHGLWLVEDCCDALGST